MLFAVVKDNTVPAAAVVEPTKEPVKFTGIARVNAAPAVIAVAAAS